jgi:trehalose 6-phosphate phosphatase
MQDARRTSIVADFMNQLNHAPTSALLLDYDGTLAPFQTERDHAYPYPGVVPILDRIIRSGRTRVVVISGRPVHEVRVLLGSLNNLEIWGAHGLEHLLADGTYRQATIDSEILTVLEKARRWAVTTGFASLIETKPGGIAIHWRGLTEAEIEKTQALAQEEWTSFFGQPGLKLLRFDGGLELRTARPDKGDAVAAILRESDTNAPVVFLGDDLTDEDAFQALEGRGLSVLVRSEYRETRANAWLRPPHELISFLEQWLSSLSA